MKKTSEFINNVLDVILSKDKIFSILLILSILGFIIRVIAAVNQGVLADDMHFAPGAINFMSSGKLIYWDQSAGLWFLLTDIFYKMFGTTQLASRFVEVLFGTFLIPLMYLFTKELVKKDRIAIFAAALTAFSPFAIKSMMAEMDVMAMFFAVFALFLFLRALNNNYSRKMLVASGIMIGLAVYTKLYPLFFLPGMIFYLLYFLKKENKFNWFLFIKLCLWILIPALIFCIPEIVHNYLLYQDKGIVDDKFARIFHLEKSEQMYSWASGATSPDIKGFFLGHSSRTDSKLPLFILVFYWILIWDPLIFLLGMLGLIFVKDRKTKIFLMFSFILLYLYLASTVLLQKHFLFLSILLTIPAAQFIDKVTVKLNSKTNVLRIRYVILFILLFSLLYLGYNPQGFNIYSKSEIGKMIEYKNTNIPKDALVVVDSRIYRGSTVWLFNDRHYLEANYLNSLSSFNSSRRIPMEVYYIECTKDDCGWGTIKNQPELNQSMEKLSERFRNISSSSYTIYSIGDSKEYYIPFMKAGETPYFTIYKTQVILPQESLALADSTHVWWLYPLGYNENITPIFDKYETFTFLDSCIDKLAHVIRWLSIIIAFISIFFLFFILIEDLTKNKDLSANDSHETAKKTFE